MNLRSMIEQRLAAGLRAAGADENAPALVKPSARPEFGDYQANGCMAAAKALKTNPRQLAQQVIDAVDLSDVAEKVEIAGPGFINITLSAEMLESQIRKALSDPKLGVAPAATPQIIVVDYSSPNLAKEMHVGHLRSSIIGDAMARVLEFVGHTVIRQNHVGDWGTQFGMLLAYMDTLSVGDQVDVTEKLADLEAFYRQAKAKFDQDPEFADASRRAVVELQGGNEHYLALWQRFVSTSLSHCQAVYDRLNVTLGPENVYGESQYNGDLPKVVADLEEAGLLTESDGAQCVFLDEFKGKDDEPLPVIVRKSDGGYLYATTDLAAMRYRARHLGAKRILYVTDSRQALHFAQVFAVARKAGFVGQAVSLEHIPFGTMMGPDGKPFATRTGGTLKLIDLLDEAEKRAAELIDEKSPELDARQRRQVAAVVGTGAVKYADLSQNRTSDYLFNWDKMISMDGNTAPYMQYAYARVRSIFRKGQLQETAAVGDVHIDAPAERALALKLAQLPEIIETVASDCMPNVLCAYLFELAGAFMSFYEACPVLKADEQTRTSRLMLCLVTARVIQCGLNLLGIETLEQM